MSWGVKPLFTTLNLNAWAFWIVIFVLVLSIFALMRIIWIIYSQKLKRPTITVIDLHRDNCFNSSQSIYTSAIASNYYHNNEFNTTESSDNNMKEDIEFINRIRYETKSYDSLDGVDNVSESCVSRPITPISPLTPAYKPHEFISTKDPLGFLSVPPGFVSGLSYNTLRIERNTHSA